MSNTISNTISNTMSNTMSNNILNNLINFQNIFAYNRKIDKSIIFLKKTEFDIFYSCKYKYPTLVFNFSGEISI